jgi:hypothetical protein
MAEPVGGCTTRLFIERAFNSKVAFMKITDGAMEYQLTAASTPATGSPLCFWRLPGSIFLVELSILMNLSANRTRIGSNAATPPFVAFLLLLNSG